METPASDGQIPPSPAFSYRRWLHWFFLLLLPFGLIIALFVVTETGWFEILIALVPISYFLFGIFVLIAAIPQWIYLRRKVRRAAVWVFIQLLIYCLVALSFAFIFEAQIFLFTRNFVWWARMFSFTIILIAFLLPGMLLRFEFFHSRKVPVSRGWFRDYALVFALGLGIFLVYDWFTEGRPAPITGLHGALYTGMIATSLYLSAGQGWVLARVRFPPLPPKKRKGQPLPEPGPIKSV